MSETAENPQPRGVPRSREPASSRLRGLIRLLADDDPKILRAAWEHLEKLGEQALPALQGAAREAADPRLRLEARRFLKERRRREVFKRWVAFCQRRPLDLEDGAFLIAESEYPEADLAACRKRLDEFAAVLGRRTATARTAEAAVQRLVRFLHDELGFAGNFLEYYDPDNSYLHRVLERKVGIPIALATVYLLVARRLSLPLEGVGMPQHFLLKFKAPAGQRFIDPFHGGKQLSSADCARYLDENGIAFQEHYLDAVSDQVILSRTLCNLLRIYHARRDERREKRVAAMLKLLEG
jgi:regulator of sirC expression with transglutaminase-like and TPR domain